MRLKRVAAFAGGSELNELALEIPDPIRNGDAVQNAGYVVGFIGIENESSNYLFVVIGVPVSEDLPTAGTFHEYPKMLSISSYRMMDKSDTRDGGS